MGGGVIEGCGGGVKVETTVKCHFEKMLRQVLRKKSVWDVRRGGSCCIHINSQPDKEKLRTELLQQQKTATEKTVDWFMTNMPKSYFRAINEEDQLQHLNAISSLQYNNALSPELLLQSKDGKVFSYFRSGKNYPGLLSNILAQLPKDSDRTLARVKIFCALDDTLSLDVFRFGQQSLFANKTPEEQQAYDSIHQTCRQLQEGKFRDDPSYPQPNACFEPEQVDAFLRGANSMYVQFSNPRRLLSQMSLFARVKGTEGVAVDIEHGWETKSDENKFSTSSLPQTMITMAGANVLPESTLKKAATYLALRNLNIVRAHMDMVEYDSSEKSHVAMVRILVSPREEDAQNPLDWEEIVTDLRFLKWQDDRVLNLVLANPEIVDLHTAEIIITYAQMLHGKLAKTDPFAYSLQRIMTVLGHEQQLPLANNIAQFFLRKFDPKQTRMSDSEQSEEVDRLKTEIRKYVETEDAIHLLNEFVDAVAGTLRTNKFVPTRYALSLRMDPKTLGYGTVGDEIPFGTFFIHGRRFKGFHVRFRDISRGGLRVVSPANNEQHSFESARQYNEAYNLAFAQQLKNKDIPEGGSKAVVLVEQMYANDEKFSSNFIIRKSVKAFSDALLDLNTEDLEVKKLLVDYYNKDELIYLGPDENVVPADITWMTKRAAYRGYPCPRAFISSKPDAGINHKVYGVTSEGVAVFVDVALHSQGFDPKNKPFTVKITGGTDGDVAGNIISILHREYGDNVRIVGICDGTAVIESADQASGINMQELLRLVKEELPLSSFQNKDDRTLMHLADNPEGIRLRNSMHNRVESDLFVPAGGRPNTINENNVDQFINPETGKPSSKLIVEGANLFVTPGARKELFDKAGVVIVKDSSANKCGVVCSSYEIIASMMLETNTFLAIKDELVSDVLTKLRHLARVEAELLFREYNKNPSQALPPYSERISRAIIRIHDAILDKLDNDNLLETNAQTKDLLYTLIEEHLPAKLHEQVPLETILETVPKAYIQSILASNLASKIVYTEGLQYAEALPEGNLADLAIKYLTQEKKVKLLVELLQESEVPQKQEMIDLLQQGGARSAMEKL